MKPIREQEQKQDQLDNMEDVLQQLINQIVELKNKEINFPEIKLPDYTDQLDQIVLKLKTLEENHPAEATKNLVQSLEEKIQRIPQQIPVKNRHHIETRSKGFLITGLLLILVSAFSVGLFAHTWSQNKGLKENDLKYRMIRFQYPKASLWVDSVYRKDPKAAHRLTIELEREERTLLKAEAEARQKEAEATEARQEADRLKER